MTTDATRRRVLVGLAGLLVAAPAMAAFPLQPTPRQTPGPFYPRNKPLDDDSDLTRVQGEDGVAEGQITELSGRLLDVNGRPITNARVEIWQCDARGRYRHPRDSSPQPVDERFQGFGHSITDSSGDYRFRTIRPVQYPGRTPHIHMAVFTQDAAPFVTQLYVAGEPRNAQDFLFNSMPVERRHLVLAEFVPIHHPQVAFRASFDIVLGGVDGTPAV